MKRLTADRFVAVGMMLVAPVGVIGLVSSLRNGESGYATIYAAVAVASSAAGLRSLRYGA